MNTIATGIHRGVVTAPPSKSHEHRLLIADFLAGDRSRLADAAGDNADILATKRCLRALAEPGGTPVLDCGESGSTLRFLAPVAAALGKRPEYIRRGRLAERPMKEYPTLASGLHELAGNISSQFVTGLLFALPLQEGDSEISFTSPLESRGYVDMTLRVLAGAGIRVVETADGFRIPGSQRYLPQPRTAVEGDWSGAAFWFVMNAFGCGVEVRGLVGDSAQPDRAIMTLLGADPAGGGATLSALPREVDVSQYPDIFPVLAVAAAGRGGETRFTGIARLRLKECDRVAAMAETLGRLGAEVREEPEAFAVRGTDGPFRGGDFRSFGDHRIAMSVAVAAVRSAGAVSVDDAACAAKSYPGFFAEFRRTIV